MIATAERRTLLTVGIPVHNAMPFLKAAIESILGQTYQDFQLLVIVDGSTDGSLEYLQTIRDARLRILVQQHCGLTFTLNRMLRECATEWLVRQDADDLSDPSRLQIISDAIAAHPRAGMFYSLAAYYPQHKSVGIFRSTRGTPEQIRDIVRTGYIPAICHPTAILHVERTLALSGYRPGICCEDADLWWRMALAYDIQFIPKVLLYFRQNATSLTSRHLEEQQLHGLYVQYLLLSQLQSRTARPLSEVESVLRGLMRADHLSAKQALRQFNISLGQGQRTHAYQSLLRAFAASPLYMLRRLRDELSPNRTIHNGIEPNCSTGKRLFYGTRSRAKQPVARACASAGSHQFCPAHLSRQRSDRCAYYAAGHRVAARSARRKGSRCASNADHGTQRLPRLSC